MSIRKNRKIKKDDWDDILLMREGGLTWAKIAEKYNCSKTTVMSHHARAVRRNRKRDTVIDCC